MDMMEKTLGIGHGRMDMDIDAHVSSTHVLGWQLVAWAYIKR